MSATGPVVIRRTVAGTAERYVPQPEHPWTGPTSFVRKTDQVLEAREKYVPPVPANPRLSHDPTALRLAHIECGRCGHQRDAHEHMRRSDRCAQCTCQQFVDYVVPTSEEEESRRQFWIEWVAIAGPSAFVGAGVVLIVQMLMGVRP